MRDWKFYGLRVALAVVTAALAASLSDGAMLSASEAVSLLSVSHPAVTVSTEGLLVSRCVLEAYAAAASIPYVHREEQAKTMVWAG